MGFLAWEAWWGKTLTMNKSKKRGYSLANRYPLSGKEEEVLEHLFIYCPKVWGLWSALFSLSGGGWVCHFLVKDLILGWIRISLRKKDFVLDVGDLEGEERVVFEDGIISSDKVKSYFFRSLCS